MAHIIADRVKETSTTTGTGALTLAGAVTGFQAFSAACAVGDTLYYALQAVDASGVPTGDWECGLGTYSGANTLTRTTVTSSSNAGAAVSLAAGTKQVYISMPAVQVAWAREKLTAARTYYVRTDGADTNTGLANTAGGAFLTIQKAIDVAQSIDASIYQVTIQIADGSYTQNLTMPSPMVGKLKLIIQGNATTPTNVVLNGYFFASANAYAYIKDFKVTGGTIGLGTESGAIVEFSGLDFGAASARHISVAYGSYINCSGAYTISGDSPSHILIDNASSYRGGGVCTLSGTRAFSTAFIVGSGGAQYIKAGSGSYSGTATGTRYSATLNAVINTAGGGASFFPGNAAGTTATGGQYA